MYLDLSCFDLINNFQVLYNEFQQLGFSFLQVTFWDVDTTDLN